MTTTENVVWKCGSCSECFYDLQILAGHKCIGSGTPLNFNENCIKGLQIQSYDVSELDATAQVQEIGGLSIIPSDIDDIAYGNVFKPTVIAVKKNPLTKKHQKGKRSIVWTYFTALDDKKAVCSICQKVISYCGTPTNLVYHLSRYHPAEGDVVKSKQANNVKYQYLANKLPKLFSSKKVKRKTKNICTIPQASIENIASVTATTLTKKVNLTDKIIEMLHIDMLPVNIVQGEGFQKFLQGIDPSYNLPLKKEFFVEHIPKKYYAELKKVQKMLKDTDKVHVSVELWNGYDDQDFITISSHFVTNDYQYKHYALNTICLEENATPENIMTNIFTCISQWDLSLNIMCIVTDGNEVMAEASSLTGWKTVKCFAHTLDIIINEALSASSELNKLLQKCRRVVSFLRSNEAAKQQLLEIQMADKQLKIQHSQSQIPDINAGIDEKYPLKLKKDNPKEWLSTFYMLQRIATLKVIITKLLASFPQSSDTFTNKDWNAIDETISLLKSFEVVILELCHEPFQFASKVIPVTLGLVSLINDCNTLKMKSIQEIREDIQSALHKHLGRVEHNIVLAMATVLDPRFKNIAFQSEEAVEAVIEALQSEACKQVDNDSSLMGQSAYTHGNHKDISSSTDSLWAGFDKKATPKKAPATVNDAVSNEIKNYLEEPLLDRKKNPFFWWKRQGQALFPILAKIAKHVVCIPATSIPPERLFLKKGRSFEAARKLIKPKYIDQFMFLNLNID